VVDLYGGVSVLGLSLIVVVNTIFSVRKECIALGQRQLGLVAFTLLGLVLLAHGLYRFDTAHFLPVLFFVTLAGAEVLLCHSLPRWSRLFRLQMLMAFALMVALAPVLSLSLYRATIGVSPPWRCYSHLERAACATIEPDEEQAIDYTLAHTHKDEYIFVGNQRHDLGTVNDSVFYFLADRPIPVAYHQMDPGSVTTTPVQQVIVDDLRSKR
jgi:hypothetical protein